MEVLKNSLLTCLILLIISCESDDGSLVDTGAQEDALVGTWNLIEESQEGTGTATIDGFPLTGNISSFAKDIDAQIIISKTPNVITPSGSYTEVITVSFLTITRNEEISVFLGGEINQASWSLNDGVLELLDGNETQEINIITLTATTLKVEINVVRDIVIDGIDIAVDTIIKMTFEK